MKALEQLKISLLSLMQQSTSSADNISAIYALRAPYTCKSCLLILTRKLDSAMFHHTPHVSCLSRPVVKMSLSKQVTAAVIVLDELEERTEEKGNVVIELVTE